MCRSDESSRSVQRSVAFNAPLLVNADAPERTHNQCDSPGGSKSLLCDGAFVVAALSLVNAALGAGVLAYPFAFMSAGLIAASLCTAILGALSFLSLCIIFYSMAVVR